MVQRLDTPLVLWIMGPTSSGKTTVAEAFCRAVRKHGLAILHFDGDEVRDFFGESLGFAAEDRLRVVKTILHLAGKAHQAGVHTVVSALTANGCAREELARRLPDAAVCYLECDLATCAARDPKGLYRLAKDKQIDTLIGYNSVYQPPTRYDFRINTTKTPVDDAVTLLLQGLTAKGHLDLHPGRTLAGSRED